MAWSDWRHEHKGPTIPDVGRLRYDLVIRMQSSETARRSCVALGSRRRASSGGRVGWIAAIIIGASAGWLAEQFMKSNMGLLMNVVLGIVGAAVASALLSIVGINLGGWIGYLICGFIGACI